MRALKKMSKDKPPKSLAAVSAKAALMKQGHAKTGSGHDVKRRNMKKGKELAVEKKPKELKLQESILKKIREKAVAQELPKIPIGGLKFKHLHVGMTCLGQIKEITATDMKVYLPNGLVGFLSMMDITAQYHQAIESLLVEEDNESEAQEVADEDKEAFLTLWKQWFKGGQLLPFSIKALDKAVIKNASSNKKGRYICRDPVEFEYHNRVECSIRPEILNKDLKSLWTGQQLAVSVEAIEDKGVRVKINDSLQGFYRCKDAADMQPGQWLFLEVSETGRINQFCKIERKKSTPFLGIPSKAIDEYERMSHFQAGSLLSNVKLAKIVPGKGLILEISGQLKKFFGIVEMLHIPHNKAISSFFEGEILPMARVLYVSDEGDRPDSWLSLSLLPHLLDDVDASMFGNLTYVGRIITNLKIDRVDLKTGLEVTFGFTDDHAATSKGKNARSHGKYRGFVKCQNSMLMSEGAIIEKARIVNFFPLENLFILSMDDEILGMPFLSYGELALGMKVRGKIIKAMDTGMVVELSSSVKGFCPSNHLSEGRNDVVSNRAAIKLGQDLSFIVWNLNVSDRKILLSRKPTLLASTFLADPFSSNEIAKDRTLPYHGIVISVKPKIGAIVSFIGDSRGFLPISAISPGVFIKNLESLLPIGSVIKAWSMNDGNKVTMVPPDGYKEDAVIDESVDMIDQDKQKKTTTKAASSSCSAINDEASSTKALKSSFSKRKATEDYSMPTSIDDILNAANPLSVATTDDGHPVSDASAQESLNNENGASVKIRKKSRRDEELEISKIEESLLEEKQVLDCVEDFEKALISDSKRPVLWIQYLMWMLSQIVEPTPEGTNKAQKTKGLVISMDTIRSVFARALDAIPYAAAEDSLKLWTFFINLEYQLSQNVIKLKAVKGSMTDVGGGVSKTDHFTELIEDALKRNSPQKIFSILHDLYSNHFWEAFKAAGKEQDTTSVDLRSIYERVKSIETRMFKKSSSVKNALDLWIKSWHFHFYLFKRGLKDRLGLAEAALQEIEKRAEVLLSSGDLTMFKLKIASTHYAAAMNVREEANESCASEDGDDDDDDDASPAVDIKGIEIARSLFENLVASHPRRFDLWSVYLHKEIKLVGLLRVQNDDDDDDAREFEAALSHARLLFDRAVSMCSRKSETTAEKHHQATTTSNGGDSSAFFNHRQVKELFKMYLELEMLYGTKKSTSNVKTMASNYLANK